MDIVYRGIIILLASAVTGEKRQLPDGFSLEEALPIIRRQYLVSLAFQGALNCGISPKDPVMTMLMQQYIKLLVLSEKQMRAVQQIFAAFEENEIEYLPLKGCRMKALYPKPELRTMGDADILIRNEQYNRVEAMMTTLGFTMVTESDYDYKWSREDLTVELHRYLISPTEEVYYKYFNTGWKRAVKEQDCRYVFSAEDTFIYQFVHMTKHYQNYGIGCRHILDLYVFLRENKRIDETYIEAELEKLHLLTFYRNIRRVLKTWFEGDTSDKVTEYITAYVFGGGSWGSQETGIRTEELRRSLKRNGIRNSQCRYLSRLVFPSAKSLETRYPVLRKTVWMLPAVWIFRWIELLLYRRRNIRKKLSYMPRMTDHFLLERQSDLRFVGLDLEYSAE